MRRTSLLLCSVTFPLLFACAAAPPAPPEELASMLLSELDAGRAPEARELFEPVADDEVYRDKIYPVLYGAARARYQEGNAAGAAVVLRFLHESYPAAASVREALLYALFLGRAGKAPADPDLGIEIEELLAEVRQQSPPLPVWIELIEAQQGIDRGDQDRARAAYERFLATWDRRPNEVLLALYVDDIGRSLALAGGGR